MPNRCPSLDKAPGKADMDSACRLERGLGVLSIDGSR